MLPYNPQQAQQQLIDPNAVGNQLAPTLVNYAASQPVRNFIPYIVALTVDIIQRNCNKSPLRMFLFNQMANNNYQNNDFFGLLQFIINILDYHVLSNNVNVNNLQQFITSNNNQLGEIDKMITLKVAKLLYDYQELQQYVQQDTLNDAHNQFNMINEYNNIAARVIAQKQNTMQGNQQSNMMPARNNSFFSSSNQPNNFSPTMNNFQNNISAAIVSSPVNNNFAPVSNTNNPVNINNNFSTQTPFVNTPVVEPQIAPSTKWKWTQQNPYPVAYTPSKYKLVYDSNKNYQAVLIQGSGMDLKNHVIGTISSPQIASVAQTSEIRLTNTDKTVRYLFDSGDYDINSPLVIKEQKTILDEQDITLFNNECISTLAITVCLFVRQYVCDKYAESIVERMASCVDFVQLINILKTENAKAVIEKKPRIVKFLNEFNKKMTRFINYYTKNILVVNVNIDSFIEDGLEVITYIERNLSTEIADIFRANQDKIIRYNTAVISQKCAKELFNTTTATAKLFEDESTASLIIFNELYCLVSTNYYSTDLDFNYGDDTVASKLDINSTPVLYHLVASIFDYIDSKCSSLRNEMFKCKLRTKDEMVYMLTRSDKDHNVLLINKDC